MNPNLKLYCFISIFSTILISNSNSQLLEKDIDSLILNDLGRKIENSIRFNVSNYNLEKIHAISGKKVIVGATDLIINGDTLKPSSISTKGQSSLNFTRKSFSVELKSKATFHHGTRTESLRKFNLVSLSMDRNYCSNRLAFELMEELHLFPLFYSFCELWINGGSEGIYMIIQRPEDWAIKMKGSPVIIRRGYDHSIDKIKTGVTTTSADIRNERNNFNLIYKSLDKYEGEQLYNVLSGLLDMHAYLKWIAFNFYVKNGDYTDEVYFYADSGIYNIIPWDYDDLFSSVPHEGETVNKAIRTDKLFFSTEDLLDRKIVSDPYLYKIYLLHLREMLGELTPEIIERAFENTYADLYPFYSNSEIISKSGYDLYPRATLTKLREELSTLYVKLLIFRDVYMKDINKKIK